MVITSEQNTLNTCKMLQPIAFHQLQETYTYYSHKSCSDTKTLYIRSFLFHFTQWHTSTEASLQPSGPVHNPNGSVGVYPVMSRRVCGL